jgi:hypothetical protein
MSFERVGTAWYKQYQSPCTVTDYEWKNLLSDNHLVLVNTSGKFELDSDSIITFIYNNKHYESYVKYNKDYTPKPTKEFYKKLRTDYNAILYFIKQGLDKLNGCFDIALVSWVDNKPKRYQIIEDPKTGERVIYDDTGLEVETIRGLKQYSDLEKRRSDVEEYNNIYTDLCDD